MPSLFYLEKFDEIGKTQRLRSLGPDLCLTVDYDDVDHYQTARMLAKAVRILNDHWDDPEYKMSKLFGREVSDKNREHRAANIMRSLEKAKE